MDKKMARQIQIRRGTAEEHKNFTGAIGEITMDTTNNTLCVHDGETAGGTPLAKQSDLDNADYVIDAWCNTDKTQWYRKYKSGWLEQGGYGTISNTSKKIIFQIAFNQKPTVHVSGVYENGTSWAFIKKGPTNTEFEAGIHGTGGYSSSPYISWTACGYSN